MEKTSWPYKTVYVIFCICYLLVKRILGQTDGPSDCWAGQIGDVGNNMWSRLFRHRTMNGYRGTVHQPQWRIKASRGVLKGIIAPPPLEN